MWHFNLVVIWKISDFKTVNYKKKRFEEEKHDGYIIFCTMKNKICYRFLENVLPYSPVGDYV